MDLHSKNSTPRLNTLILEDDADDRFLLERALRRSGVDFAPTWVDCRGDFVRALQAGRPDVILADCNLPDIDGAGALEIARRMHPDAPVVMVTGGLTDEKAAELLAAGAHDYVLKDRLARLGSAVVAAIERAGAQARQLAGAERMKAALAATVNAIMRTLEKRDRTRPATSSAWPGSRSRSRAAWASPTASSTGCAWVRACTTWARSTSRARS